MDDILTNLRKRKDDLQKMPVQKGPMIFAMFVLFIIMLILVASVLRNVEAGYAVVGTKGSSEGDVKSSGWQWCKWFQGWHEVRVKTQQMSFVGYDSRGDSKGSIDLLTKDNLEVYMDLTVVYHLRENTVGKLITEHGKDFKDVVMKPIIRNVPRQIATSYVALELIGEKRVEFQEMVQTNITERLETYFIYIESVNVRALRIPDAVMKAVEDKKVAEQKIITAQYELEEQEYIAEKKIVDANADRNVTIIGAEAQAEAILIVMEQIAVDSGNMTTTEAYLNYLYMLALRDPDSNVKFVITDGTTPILLNAEGAV